MNGTGYCYLKNLQGDVVALTDYGGAIVARYTYDAWGKLLTVTDANGNDISSNASHIANLNPIRYRSYVYDTESGFYYLTSRYYDPTVGRFISADGYASTGQGYLGHNMFAYCNNNPINYADHTGTRAGHLGPTMVYVNDGGGGVLTDEEIFSIRLDIDLRNFDINNTDPEVVREAYYFSAYKGTLVLIHPIEGLTSWAAGGIIWLKNEEQRKDLTTFMNTLNHEYGHILQEKKLGFLTYLVEVGIPSITINILDQLGKLPYDYYSYPWEAEANELGGSTSSQPRKPKLPEGEYTSYWDLWSFLFQ